MSLRVRIVRRPDEEGVRQVAGSEGLNLAPLSLDRCAGCEDPRASMEGRGKGHSAEAIHRVQHVVIIAVQERPFERWRDSNRSREADAMRLLQAPRELCGEEAAIALADDGNGHVPKLVPREKPLDELAQRLQIAVERVEFLLLDGLCRLGLLLLVGLLLGLDDAREAGADWVDKHEVGESDPAFRIVDEPHRRRLEIAVGLEEHAPGGKPADMKIGGGRPWAAIEDETDRSPALGGPLGLPL